MELSKNGRIRRAMGARHRLAAFPGKLRSEVLISSGPHQDLRSTVGFAGAVVKSS
jgi:hypothetical protein